MLDLSSAARDVIAERARQQSQEGWSPEHDDEHTRGELAVAAASYAYVATVSDRTRKSWRPDWWPWDFSWWKPKTRRHDLVRAGALILAEIERLDRQAAKG
jgi:hypothetical protein